MSKYSVLIEGSGINLQHQDSDILCGFFVVKIVSASSESDAVTRAKEEVKAEWKCGKFSTHEMVPLLESSEVKRLGFLTSLRAKSTSYIFHPGKV